MYEKKLYQIFIAVRLIRANNAECREKEEKSYANAAGVLAYKLLEFSVFKVESEIVEHNVNAEYALYAGG